MFFIKPFIYLFSTHLCFCDLRFQQKAMHSALPKLCQQRAIWLFHGRIHKPKSSGPSEHTHLGMVPLTLLDVRKSQRGQGCCREGSLDSSDAGMKGHHLWWARHTAPCDGTKPRWKRRHGTSHSTKRPIARSHPPGLPQKYPPEATFKRPLWGVDGCSGDAGRGGQNRGPETVSFIQVIGDCQAASPPSSDSLHNFVNASWSLFHENCDV